MDAGANKYDGVSWQQCGHVQFGSAESGSVFASATSPDGEKKDNS